MRGVERSSVGIKVNQEGMFADLGSVHFAADTAANILSLGELEDRCVEV